MADPLRAIRVELSCLLLAAKEPLSARCITQKYFEDYDGILVPGKYGYETVEKLLSAMPDDIQMTLNAYGEPMFIAKRTEKLADIQKLVQRQKSRVVPSSNDAYAQARSMYQMRGGIRPRASRRSTYGIAFTDDVLKQVPAGSSFLSRTLPLPIRPTADVPILKDDGPYGKMRCARIAELVREHGEPSASGIIRMPIERLKELFLKTFRLPLWGKMRSNREYAAQMGSEEYKEFWTIEDSKDYADSYYIVVPREKPSDRESSETTEKPAAVKPLKRERFSCPDANAYSHNRGAFVCSSPSNRNEVVCASRVTSPVDSVNWSHHPGHGDGPMSTSTQNEYEVDELGQVSRKKSIPELRSMTGTIEVPPCQYDSNVMKFFAAIKEVIVSMDKEARDQVLHSAIGFAQLCKSFAETEVDNWGTVMDDLKRNL